MNQEMKMNTIMNEKINYQKQHKLKQASGFTLIEIMVVVVIIGVLAALIVPNVISRPDEARVIKVRQDLRSIEAALNLYRLDNYTYPTTEEGLAKLVGRYLDRLPKDPWQRDYLYISPGEHGDIDVYTEGADGVDGGEGVNKKMGNWEN